MDLSSLLSDDEELTPLYDAEIPRVDLVSRSANGVPRFLLAKQDEASAGLLDPEFVRDLIAKADPEPDRRERVTTPSGLTLSGSPADIAAFIHKAAARAAEAKPTDAEISEWPDQVRKNSEARNAVARHAHETGADISKAVRAHMEASKQRAAWTLADAAGDVAKAEMSGKSQNDLPDDQFAYIEPGGKKDADGKTTPRSLRHFPINDAAHVRNALARASSSPFGDKAMPKIRAAAKRFKIDVSKEAGVPETVAKDMADMADDDCMDPTVPMAEPDGDYAGSPAEPGSPMWEAVDAATACKWTSMLARARAAVSLLADREMMEAASGDEGDAENAFNLQDACCAIDFAIGVLAPFAVAEQSEADCGDMDAMAMVGKSGADRTVTLEAVAKALAAADLADPLAKLEGLTGVIKAGRVLSSVNEAHIREAAGRLNTVLQSLPQAPTADDGQPVAKEQETTVADTETQDAQVAKDGAPASPEMQAKNSGPVNAGGTTGMGQPRATGPAASLPDDGPQAALPGDAQTPGRTVVKADGEGKTPMCVVYDQKGRLIGIVAPDDITPVANSEAEPEDDMDPDGDGTEAAAPADASTDMTPMPAGDTGTPAGAVPDDGTVAKSEEPAPPASATNHLISPGALESIIAKAVAAALGTAAPQEDIAKTADVAGLAEQVETLKARLATVEEQPAAPRVFTNGAVPPAHQMRGQDQGAAPGQVDVAKALDLKHEMYTAGPAKAKKIQDDMTQMAIDQLASIHRR